MHQGFIQIQDQTLFGLEYPKSTRALFASSFFLLLFSPLLLPDPPIFSFRQLSRSGYSRSSPSKILPQSCHIVIVNHCYCYCYCYCCYCFYCFYCCYCCYCCYCYCYCCCVLFGALGLGVGVIRATRCEWRGSRLHQAGALANGK